MIDIDKIEVTMVLISHESDPLWAEEPRKRDKVLIGTVVAINHKAGEVVLRVNRELRTFKPENLWYLPYEAKSTRSDDVKEKLMGFIVGIYEGQVGTTGIQEVANLFKERGIGPVRTQKLIEAL